MITVYITCRDKKEALTISNDLLKQKLCVCANLFPVDSHYLWQGEIENSNEVAILAKTSKSKFRELEQAVKKLHSYEVPCVCAWEIAEINKDYREWAENETK